MGVGLDGRLSVSVIPAGCARAPGAPPAPARHRRRLPARLACRGEDVAPPNGRIAAKRHWTAPSCFVRQGQQGQPGPRGVRRGFSALQRAVPAHRQRGARPVPRVRAAVGGARACGLDPDGGSRDTDPGAGPHLPGHCARDAATSRACRPSGTARPTASPGSSVGTAPCPSCPSSWLAELLPGVSPITSRIVPGRVLSLVPLLQRGGAVCGAGRGKLRSPRSKGVRARDG